jgi:two-component system, NarL family, sensor histidine kinase BarA
MVQEVHRGKADKWIGIHSIMDYSREINKFVKMGTTSSNQLLALIEDILDLSKIESGIFSINMSEFVVKPMVMEVLDIFEIQCKQKGIKLEWNIDEIFNKMVVSSDRGRIKQVLLNLFSNSFKFTPYGKITLNVGLVAQEKDEYIEFSVKDTGIGIKKEDQKKLFQLFSKLSQQDNINPYGWGIGLTISKKYVEALNGEIKLKSVEAEGTTVEFRIPLIKVHNSNILDTMREECSMDHRLVVDEEGSPLRIK